MKYQVIKNILANSFNLIISISVTLYLTPVLVKNLGMDVYGVLPIALLVTFYMGVIGQSITASVNRFLIASINSNDYLNSSKIFSTAFILINLYVLILLLLFWYPIYHIQDFIKIPKGSESDSQYLFHCILFSFALAMLSSIISVTMYARNRIDLIQGGNIVRNLVKLISLLLFFHNGMNSLKYVGLAIVFSEFFCLIYCVFQWHILMPELRIKYSYIDRGNVKKLASFSGWVLFDQIGSVLFLKTDLLLVNNLMGSKASGQYSVAAQFSDLLRSIAGLVAGSLGPVMMMLYEKKEFERLTSFTIIFVKIISLTISIPIILLSVFSSEILNLWLGEEYEHLAFLIGLVTLPLIINLGALPLLYINLAVKKIKPPAVVNVILAILGVILSLVLYDVFDMGYYSIAFIYMTLLTLKNALFIPWYAAYILNKKWYIFFKAYIVAIGFSCVYYLLVSMVKTHTLFESDFLFYEILSLGCVGILSSFLFYSSQEKKEFIALLKSKGKK